MSLQTYNARRRFDKTPEPEGTDAKPGGSSFVIQKHAARRLHYDFRLELDGVLKSWAVTRGPSLDPEDKRLAVEVEDHPLAYGDFEGEIPKGQYGAGAVILWDRGIWHAIGDAHKGLKKGHLEFSLEGEKLSGRWHLVRMKPRSGEKRNNWLLIKGEDEAARPDHGDELLEEMPLSVKSKKRIEEMAKAPVARWSNGKAVGEPAPKGSATETNWPKGAKRGRLPGFVEPQLATLKAAPPKGAAWLHEIKFDGYRIQVRLDHGEIALLTRSGLDWTEKFGVDLAQALRALPAEAALLDGEMVVERANGVSDFSALQKDLSEERSDRFVFYAFDILHLNGHDLRAAALKDRKAKLEVLLKNVGPRIRYSAHFDEAGGLVLDHACRLSLEGVVSKRADGKYRSGRTGQWIKSKCSERQEFVIGGYAPSSTSKTAIGSLALGVYEGEALRHVGRVGTGFSRDVAEMLFDRLKPLVTEKSPFAEALDASARRQLVFVKPELVAEVEFRAWSADGNLRHAAFRGIREDKPAREIVKEGKVEARPKAPQSQVKLTHPDRLYWPDDGVTKQGLVDYYAEAWRLMAPFVVDRPLALVRCPDGIQGPHFFQKHGWRGMNKSINEIIDPKDKGGKPALRILDFDGLVALAQSGCLEIHPWGTTTRNWEQPDMITMDLDPADDVEWSAVIDAAQGLKDRVEKDGLAAFVKTSGGKGLHVVIPLKPQARWPKVKAYAKRLATDMAKDDPARYIAVATKAKRHGRIFIDYLRNGRGSTAVAAYSTRARPGAAISMPLDWSELTPDIGPAHFSLGNVRGRLDNLASDPWADFFEAARPLP
ncbi:bifunctional non-homologous end joining protein LigD [Ensifer adhaerens]|nr:bifunctional non-homologous end joining protein LigD [Ensifer adhaerens]